MKRPALISAMFLLAYCIFLLTSVATAAPGDAPLPPETKLLRMPDVYGESIVFCYAGDLWTVSTSGGTASRLTAHEGQEVFPRFSPDGQWIAFTGQYDGDEQVYVIPAIGGAPRQLTYYPAHASSAPRHGIDHQVHGWTPSGDAVLFRSMRDANGGSTETALYTVSLEGGLPTKLPMPTAGAGDFSSDGSQIAYCPLFRDFRTWKRYEGGWAQYISIFDLESHESKTIAYTARSERDPMWIGKDVYFTSDRDGTLNLYKYEVKKDRVQQLTQSELWDVRWPSSDNESRIIYELSGQLHIHDVTQSGNRAHKRLRIHVPHDGLAMRPSRLDVSGDIEDYDLSPQGERAVFVARGDVFTVPIENGPTRNLTRSSGAHDREARWSPDGKSIAFVSDMTGEEQLYVVDQEGGEPERLTNQFEGMLFSPIWSPDSLKIAITDKNGKLYVVTLEDKSIVEIADNEHGNRMDVAWSPCSGHIAYTLNEETDFRTIYIWSESDGESRKVTDAYADEFDPTWDPDGDFLFYLAKREFAPQISSIEWNYAGNRDIAIFALALREDVEHPFLPESDEVAIDTDEEEESEENADEEASDEEESEEEDDASEPLVIDFDGLADRVARIPVSPDNYSSLHAIQGGKLLFTRRGAGFYGRGSYEDTSLRIFDMEARKESVVAENAGGYAYAKDGRTVLVRQNGDYRLMEIKSGGGEKKTVSTRDLAVDRIPEEEWLEVFDETWRRFRDFFYVQNMHGYNWEKIGKRYRRLVPHVAHRSDLNYLLGEMISELCVGHAYIQGGDFTSPQRPKVALPGCRFELDGEANRYLISKIFEGENQETKYRAPLSEIGVAIEEGLYVLAIDGDQLLGDDNPYRLLRHKTDPVTLTVNESPELEGSREVVFNPIFSESKLLYLDWVLSNMRKVDEATDGRVGYIHIPDMGADGIYEFIKWYYPQIRKEGLVIDDRSNGGGNVSQWIIERLDTRLLGTRFGSTRSSARTYPYTVFHGHLACLINETSASDGDIFPHYFRESGLGPLIGKRTWGGVVGISGYGPLIDGGTVYVPLSATNSADGEYIIEGYGVDPDIEIDNDPASVIEGLDPQLQRGIEEVLRKIEEDPRSLPERPEDPVKTE
jgi:tricorn protease